MNNIPSDSMETTFQKYEVDFFASQVSSTQLGLIKKIDELVNLNDLNGLAIDNLIDLRWRLSRYSESLGECISYHESRSDFAYIWRKFQVASDWIPTKKELNSVLEKSKTTNSEIDSVLTTKYIGEQFYSMFHRRRADFLMIKMDAITRHIRTIDHRLYELQRQFRLPQDNAMQVDQSR